MAAQWAWVKGRVVGIHNWVFGKRPNPRELARAWRKPLVEQKSALEREIWEITRAQKEAKHEMREAARVGQRDSARLLASEYVRANRTINRLRAAQAQLDSVMASISVRTSLQIATLSIAVSADVLRGMNELANCARTRAAAQALAQEMARAGVLDGMLDETLDSALGVDDDSADDNVADAEVDRVLAEHATNIIEQLDSATTRTPARVPARVPARASAAAAASAAHGVVGDGDDDDDDDAVTADMRARLNAMH